jgi:hypothetical protein
MEILCAVGAQAPPRSHDPAEKSRAATLIRAIGANLFVSLEQIVDRSITLANADKTQCIGVAGPDGLAAMTALCRKGFDHVEYVRRATCASADEASDMLLIVGLMQSQDLSTLIIDTCHLLNDGGALVIQLTSRGDDALVSRALAAAGMDITSSVFELSAGCLATYRVQRLAVQQRRRIA